MKCPDCGNDLSAYSYSTGDTCLDCHTFTDAADEIIHYLNKVSSAMTVVSSATKIEIRDSIKSILRDQFS